MITTTILLSIYLALVALGELWLAYRLSTAIAELRRERNNV